MMYRFEQLKRLEKYWNNQVLIQEIEIEITMSTEESVCWVFLANFGRLVLFLLRPAKNKNALEKAKVPLKGTVMYALYISNKIC